MASRLSDEQIRAVYDGGQQALAVEALRGRTAGGELSSRIFDSVDLDRLTDREDAAQAVQALPPPDLYRALVRKGLQDCLEVLPLLSDDQVIRIFDYDVWRDDRLAPLEVSKWLGLWREVGPEELYKRFRGLDEEYQIGFLNGMVELFDEEEFEKLPQADQDSLTRLPCNTLFYRLKTPDPRVDENLQALIEAALAEDVAYAYSLLNHAAYMPPNESESALARFRRARLEEDGFVSYEESLLAFRPVDVDTLTRKWAVEAPVGTSPMSSGTQEESLLSAALAAAATSDAEVADQLVRALAHLGNMVCAASRVETEDLDGQRRVLGLVQGFVNLGLEWLSGGDVQRAARVLRGEHPQTLFRFGLSLLRQLGQALLGRMAAARLPKSEQFAAYFSQARYGALLHSLDVELLPLLGLERVELLKGLLNRFPLALKASTEVLALGVPKRLVFSPIDSLAGLRHLVSRCDELAARLTLIELMAPTGLSPKQDADQVLATAIARAFAGGLLTGEPLTAAELMRVTALSPEAIKALTADIESELEEKLGAMPLWSASAGSGLPPSRPAIEGAKLVFFELVTAVLAARERAYQATSMAAWNGIVLIEGGVIHD